MKPQLLRQLQRDEGFKDHAYQDHLGYWTIGFGRLIDERKGGHITLEEGLFLLNNDIDNKTEELLKRLPWVNDLDDARKGVLVNMAFQMGVDGLLKFKNTLELIKNGKYKEASDAMLESLWAKQTPNRASRLSAQMKTGEWV
jgi:lysozyme